MTQVTATFSNDKTETIQTRIGLTDIAFYAARCNINGGWELYSVTPDTAENRKNIENILKYANKIATELNGKYKDKPIYWRRVVDRCVSAT